MLYELNVSVEDHWAEVLPNIIGDPRYAGLGKDLSKRKKLFNLYKKEVRAKKEKEREAERQREKEERAQDEREREERRKKEREERRNLEKERREKEREDGEKEREEKERKLREGVREASELEKANIENSDSQNKSNVVDLSESARDGKSGHAAGGGAGGESKLAAKPTPDSGTTSEASLGITIGGAVSDKSGIPFASVGDTSSNAVDRGTTAASPSGTDQSDANGIPNADNASSGKSSHHRSKRERDVEDGNATESDKRDDDAERDYERRREKRQKRSSNDYRSSRSDRHDRDDEYDPERDYRDNDRERDRRREDDDANEDGEEDDYEEKKDRFRRRLKKSTRMTRKTRSDDLEALYGDEKVYQDVSVQ